jgi:cytochrome c-type protein NapC
MPQNTDREDDEGSRPGRFGWARRSYGYPVLIVLVAMAVGGLIAVPVADTVDSYFSTDEFCAEACHSMEATVAKEYRESTHWATPTGVRPSCADCHISEGLTMAMWDHLWGTRDLIAFLRGVRTAEDFEEIRAESANHTRMAMVANDSKNCRTCHVMEAIQPERNRGQRQHAEALETGATCIACHYNLVHKDVEPSEEFLQAIAP